jgi:hypothetical protein
MAVRGELAPRFRDVQWIVQRVLWGLAALVLVAALLGFFGGGPLSGAEEKVEGDGYTYELSYNRWNRQKNPQELDLRVSGSNLAGESLQVTLPRSFLDDVSLDNVTPDPDSTSLRGEGSVYIWQLEEGEEFAVTFDYSADDWRTLKGDVLVAVGDSQEVLSFSQFLFP